MLNSLRKHSFLIESVEERRCLAHRMRNLAAKVPEGVWPDFKARTQAAYPAPTR